MSRSVRWLHSRAAHEHERLAAAQCALGAVFFADLILVLLDRLDVVLRSWLTGVALGVASLCMFLAIDNEVSLAVHRAGFVLVSVVLVSLLIHVRTVVSAVMSH